MPRASSNQNPEQIARDQVDAKLAETGWHVQDKDKADRPRALVQIATGSGKTSGE